MPRPATLRLAHALVLLVGACGPSTADSDAGGVESSASSTSAPVDDTLATSASVDGGSVTTTTTSGDESDATTLATSAGSEGVADESTGPPSPSMPTHLLVIRQPHGTFEEEAWAGNGEQFVLGPVLQPLAPWSDALVLVDGVDNVILPPEGAETNTVYGVSSASILTGGLLGSATVVSDLDWAFFYGGGPSLDVVLGEALGGLSPHPNVHLGVEATDGPWPTGASFSDADQPLPPMDDPAVAFATLFTGLDDPLLDELEDQLAQPIDGPGDVLERQLDIAHAAIALDVTRVQLLSIDRGLPAIMWTDLGVFVGYHELVAENNPASIRAIQTFWAERIAAFLARLESDGLLDHTLVVWLSAEGSPPAGYPTDDIFAVVVDASGTFATGRIADVDGDQADFAVTIAEAMSAPLPAFGHPDLDATVIEELLAR